MKNTENKNTDITMMVLTIAMCLMTIAVAAVTSRMGVHVPPVCMAAFLPVIIMSSGKSKSKG